MCASRDDITLGNCSKICGTKKPKATIITHFSTLMSHLIYNYNPAQDKYNTCSVFLMVGTLAKRFLGSLTT